MAALGVRDEKRNELRRSFLKRFPNDMGIIWTSAYIRVHLHVIYCSKVRLKWMLLIQEAKVARAVRMWQHNYEIRQVFREFFPQLSSTPAESCHYPTTVIPPRPREEGSEQSYLVVLPLHPYFAM